MKLEVDRNGAFPVARVMGEVRGSDAEDFTTALYDLVAGSEAKLIIDLSYLESIDSSGLGAMISLVTRARLGGGHVVMVGPSPFVSGVLNITRLDQWFDFGDTLDIAQDKLSAV